MDSARFWLARAGEVFGPYPLDQLREMSRSRELLEEDQFCREGEEEWISLPMWRKINLRTDTVKVPVAKVRGSSKATEVTAKQRALLEYLGWNVPDTRSEAIALIDAAINDLALRDGMESWKRDRLQLHPELYEVETVTYWERMAGVLEGQINGNLGPWSPIKRITKEMAKDAVDFLNARYPGWDARVLIDGFPDYDEADRWACESIAATHPEVVKKGRWCDFGPGQAYRRL
jgi:hypothetical protein